MPRINNPLIKKILIGTLAALVIGILITTYLFFVPVVNRGVAFENQLHIPALLEPTEQNGQKVFELVPQHGEMEFFADQVSETMGFNGNYLGPIIRFNHGDNVAINVVNRLDEPTAVHWHGMHVPAEMDGTPHQMIPPGQTWRAEYPVLNEAATMWYHPHPHGGTATQVSAGLAGLMIIDDENSDNLALPKTFGVDDIPLVVQDRLFDNDGQMIYQVNNGSYYGDTILVNGTIGPYVEVPPTMVRLRILNGSNGRIYTFGFEDGREFFQIASDGGFLENPTPMTRLKLSTGERAELVVDLSDGQEALFKSFPDLSYFALEDFVTNFGARHSHFDILKLVPTLDPAAGEFVTQLPERLNTIERWSVAEADNVRSLRMAGGGAGGGGAGQGIPINGQFMDMGRIDEVVILGDVEIWEITNAGGQPHPFHIHDIQFLILDRDGKEPLPGEAGWKDTVRVDPGETVRFITQFTTYANSTIPYMYHCHILEHEDGGMMGQFVVADPAAELNQKQSLVSVDKLAKISPPLLPENFFLQSSAYTCDPNSNVSLIPVN